MQIFTPARTWATRARHALLVALLTAASGAVANSVSVIVSTQGGARYDFGTVYVFLNVGSTDDGTPLRRMLCDGAKVSRSGSTFDLEVPVDAAAPTQPCETAQSIPLEELAASDYLLRIRYIGPDGATVRDDSRAFDVKHRDAVCNVSPPNRFLELWFGGRDPFDFVARYRADAHLRASLGNIIVHDPETGYGGTMVPAESAPLDDPYRVLVMLRESGEFSTVKADMPFGCGFTLCPGSSYRAAIEYFDARLGQYFYTDAPDEIAKLDAAATTSTWMRTGESFQVMDSYGQQMPVEGKIQRVYRFWNTLPTANAAHFFTVDQKECALLRDGAKSGWQFEGSVFWSSVPVAGACPAGEQPLRRLYNGSANGAPAHRFTTR